MYNDPDVCANKHGGNEESVAAFHAGDKTARRAFVYKLLTERGPATADELVALTGLTHNEISPRISELKRDGWAYDTGERRKTRKNCNAAVIKALPAV